MLRVWRECLVLREREGFGGLGTSCCIDDSASQKEALGTWESNPNPETCGSNRLPC